MKNLQAISLDGTPITLDQSIIEDFRNQLPGKILLEEDDKYDEARAVWNGMIDKHPALIVRCTVVDDIVKAINFARSHHLLLSIRGAGHNVAGNAVCEGGLMIDLSLMKAIHVDEETRIVRAEAGVTWNELDKKTLLFGLATTGGTVSSTGIAGLTLGGGVGWLMAKYGFTCDNLLSVEMVTALGEIITASENQNKDLFWALRGGGGNFGVVTSFSYQLHPIGQTVLGGMVLFPMEQAKQVLSFYRDYADNSPDDLTAFAALITTPDGLPVIAVIVGWFGALADGNKYLEPLRQFGTPLADLTGEIPYTQLQTVFDAACPYGMRRYWKSGFIPHLTDELQDIILKHDATRTSPLTTIIFFHIHGAAIRKGMGETAFCARKKQWDFDIISQWTDATEDDRQINWTQTFWKEIEPFTQGVYVNHLDSDDGSIRVQSAFGNNYKKLVQLKSKYDVQNLFRLNNNIKPEKEGLQIS
ncbi:MAG: FAD-binding oxidoreductase [Chitinophagaceae bacterium]